MMITIHGLPPRTTFQTVKTLIKQECNIIDFILDNLIDDGPNSKKVRIGVSDDTEGFRIMKCLDGFRMSPTHLLKIVPVGKALNTQQGYDQRPNFQNQPRNEYPGPSRPDYSNQSNDYGNRGPQSQPDVRNTGHIEARHYGGPSEQHHGEFRNTGPRPTFRPQFDQRQQGPMEPRHPPSQGPDSRNMGVQGSHDPTGHQWNSNVNTSNNQWIPIPQAQSQTQSNFQRPQTNFGQQQPQGQDSYVQGRGPQEQRYGFQNKPNVPDRGGHTQADVRSHNLRSVEIVDIPPRHTQYQEKPITIMKDNFQGPSQYKVSGPQHNQFQGQGPPSSWNQQSQQPKPQAYDDRHHPPVDKRPDIPKQIDQDYEKRGSFSSQMNPRQSSPGRRSPRNIPQSSGKNYPGRRMSPSGRPFPVSDRHISPTRQSMPVREYSPSGRRISPPGRRISPPGRRMSPSGRRISPPGRRMSPSGRRISPPGRRVSPSGRRISPSGRRISPSGRRMSPPGRRISPPGKRISPSGRRASPPGRRASPPGRRISPPGRRVSPSDRRISPSARRDEPRRMSPSDARRVARRESPRRVSPKRLSPTRRLVSPPRSNRYLDHHDKPVDKFLDSGDKITKPVRPAYEAVQAQNQTYTGAYRGNIRDNPQYTGRQPEPRSAPWQNDKSYLPNAKKEAIRIDIIRRSDALEKSHGRQSRSPIRRERSPIKDRYRRQSPSSRSPLSPRRSWALEKRNSPDSVREPPPPPIWPGQETEDKTKRKSRPDVDVAKHVPVWDRLDRNSDNDRRAFEDKVRVRSDLGDKFTLEPTHRREFEDRREIRPDSDRKQFERDRDYYRNEDRMELSRRRDDSPRREERSVLADIDKDFQDIYKRSVEFRKKAEELRKSGERRRDDYDDDRREADKKYRRDQSPPRGRSQERHDEFTKSGEYKTHNRKRMFLSPSVKSKRDKAIEEISNRILDKYDIRNEIKFRIMEELKLTLSSIFIDMFNDKDVSFIELVIKYQARYNQKEEEKLLQDLLSRMPTQYRNLKRKAEDTSEIPEKTSRHSPPHDVRKETGRPKLADAVIPGWNVGLEPPKVINMPLMGAMNALSSVMNIPPVMVPPPLYVSQVDVSQQNIYQNPQTSYNTVTDNGEYYNLYLCQDDFEPFSELQAEYLKNFLITQIIKFTESNQGWAPDFTLKGLQSLHRYELSTKDEASKDWLLKLSFDEFDFFNVLVYTKEELWYERAAIWLPGHSRARNIEPLDKLKLQNKHLEGVNLGKWKFVKKIVTAKGTRLYIDMPPSSARALELHKMMLSYELQKVNVFLKAVAVDKDSFDAGLKENSVTDQSTLIEAVKNSAMPTLNVNNELGLVKLGLNGNKSITIEQARKIKEVIIYHLFKYHQQDGIGKTDFLKHGFCTSGFFGIVPENHESKRWLHSRNFGKINRHAIVVFGNDDDNIKYFKMFAHIPHVYNTSTTLAFERLKQSNQGIKGVHFNLWKPIRIKNERRGAVLEIEIDLESVEAISKMNYKIDYVGEFGIQNVDIRSEYSLSKLEEKIRICKMEQVDSYDVAKMDLGSDSDNDIIYLG